ncbi:MAG: flagellar basal body L-ring protein FlgH [Janthinobacterium lividum]
MRNHLLLASLLLLQLPGISSALPHKAPKKTSEELRADYLAGVKQAIVGSPAPRTVGSLWSPEGVLTDPSADYKAHTLNDIVTVLVAVQTTAAQSGTVDSGRAFNTSSAITGLAGVSTARTNPLLAANSSTTLKGSGTTASNTAFSTSLTGQVIAVLPNGNLVVEAHRQIDMNNQHEEVIVRGIARPGDITPANTVASASLSALEIELKGKGIISDSVRSPNPVVRAILRIFGF